jgi:hypothetical protein
MDIFFLKELNSSETARIGERTIFGNCQGLGLAAARLQHQKPEPINRHCVPKGQQDGQYLEAKDS